MMGEPIKHVPIAYCIFCGDDALYVAPDGSKVCENCVYMYKPIFPENTKRRKRDPRHD